MSPRYQPEDSLKSPRFVGIPTFARLPLVRTLEEVDVLVEALEATREFFKR